MKKNWSNGMEGRIAFLDKYACEDAIAFQDVKFDVLDGYYFDEGFNTKIKEEIQVLFDKRKEEKSKMKACK